MEQESDLGHAGHASNKQHFIDVTRGHASIFHAVPAGLLCAIQQVAHQALKPVSSQHQPLLQLALKQCQKPVCKLRKATGLVALVPILCVQGVQQLMQRHTLVEELQDKVNGMSRRLKTVKQLLTRCMHFSSLHQY